MQFLYVVIAVLLIIVFIVLLTRKTPGAEVTAAVALDMIKDPQLTILDVRTPQEFAQGHIEGARLFPVAELSDRISELNELKNQQILIYCYRGNRSRTAYQILKNNGFLKIKNLQGGITAWMKSGNKVAK
jgi:rhodanese-related sulfurtransferase